MGSTKYLRAIYSLTDEGESSTRTSKVADKLDVSDASASEAVSRLQEEGLVCKADYKGFTLSPIGKSQGKSSKELHDQLVEFLEIKDVEKPEEEADAMMTSMSEESIKKIISE